MIKLGNNASARLAGAVNIFSTSIALNASEVTGFPTLGDGEWFPMTLTDSSGNMEIVRVTERNANILTVVRAQENTTAKEFTSGSRAEVRMTAIVTQTLQDDTLALAAAVDVKDAAVLAGAATSAASMDALLSAALQAIMDTKDTALHALITPEIATAKTQAQAYSDAALAAAVATLNSAIGAQADAVGSIKMWLPVAAPSGWAFCYGQALSRSTFAALFAAIGTTYGAGDGSTTFNVPDLRGRVAAGRDDMGGTPAGRLTAVGSAGVAGTLGAAGGAEQHTLGLSQIPVHSHTGTATAGGAHTPTGVTDTEAAHTHTLSSYKSSGGTATLSGGGSASVGSITSSGAGAHSHVLTIDAVPDHTHPLTVNSTGGDGAHNNVQPTLVVNFIIRV